MERLSADVRTAIAIMSLISGLAIVALGANMGEIFGGMVLVGVAIIASYSLGKTEGQHSQRQMAQKEYIEK